MNFRIADTFTDSLAKLTGDEQKAVKTSAFDLQLNPANPGFSFHKLDRAKDANFWSVRVSRDIRMIVHRTDASLLLCYVNHHDKAYRWAERRKLETHPRTGAAQWVEIRELVREVTVPKIVDQQEPIAALPLLFADQSDDLLLGYGVPEEWLADVRLVNEETLLELAEHLPAEAAEALLELATGGQPQIAHVEVDDPLSHPDAQRRFRIMANADELAVALDYPWDKWTVFLHPAQRQIVEKSYRGPARVAGSAGTGKTIVALHRAVYLARSHPEARVLLTTFSSTLANALRTRLRRLIASEPRLGERLEMDAIEEVGVRLYEAQFGKAQLARQGDIELLLEREDEQIDGQRFLPKFLLEEWREVVDAWQLESWEAYRDVKRLGRKTRLPEPRRAVLWSIFERVKAGLADQDLITHAQMFGMLEQRLKTGSNPPFEFVVVDEAQDIGVAQLRFLAALGGERENSLFFAGDLGQRIFQTPFSWRSLGVDIRGRSQTLCVNYRTSHQIRKQADRLLGPEVADVDGNTESRKGTTSVFNGPVPVVQLLRTEADENDVVCDWIKECISAGVAAHEVGIFVRSPDEIARASAVAKKCELPYQVLDERVATQSGQLSICTMHLAKGLEFRAVAVMACDDDVIPLEQRLESIADDADLEEVYNTERHLLYVACTRARDQLIVTGIAPGSEFLDDFK